MIINPLNVVRLLLASISSIYLTEIISNLNRNRIKRKYTKIIAG